MKIIIGISAFILICSCSSSGNRYDEEESQDLRVARINVELARNYILHKDYAQANAKLERALRIYPKLGDAHNIMAVLQEILGRNDVAKKHYVKALKIDNKNSAVQNNYARFLCKQNQFKKAQKHFALSYNDPLYGSRSESLVNSGICFLKEKKRDLAEEHFRIALNINDNYLPAILELADLAVIDGRWLQASSLIRRYNQMRFDLADKNGKGNPYHSRALWICVQAESNNGYNAEAVKCAIRLQNQFPESRETTELLKSNFYSRRR